MLIKIVLFYDNKIEAQPPLDKIRQKWETRNGIGAR